MSATSASVPPNRTAISRVLVVLIALVLLATACGGGSTTETSVEDSNVVDAGSFRVELPEELTAVEEDDEPAAAETTSNTASTVAEDTAGEDTAGEDGADEDNAGDEAATDDAEAEEDPDAIPLADDTDAIGGLFDAFDSFAACMERVGTVFIGAPDPADPATQDPEYLADLGLCAAESNIVQALQEAETASAERTPEETEIFNEGLLIFVDCLRGKGWTVADPTPDQNGALQVGFGGDGFVPPPGEDFIGNPNVRECGAEATREAEALTEAAE